MRQTELECCRLLLESVLFFLESLMLIRICFIHTCLHVTFHVTSGYFRSGACRWTRVLCFALDFASVIICYILISYYHAAFLLAHSPMLP